MNSLLRVIAGLVLVGLAAVLGSQGFRKMQPTTGDELLNTAEQMTGLRAPRSWKSDKSEAYMLLGVGALCLVGGLGVMMGGGSSKPS